MIKLFLRYLKILFSTISVYFRFMYDKKHLFHIYEQKSLSIFNTR